MKVLSCLFCVFFLIAQGDVSFGFQPTPTDPPPAQSCACLVLDGDTSCLDLFGVRQDSEEDQLCGIRLCAATVPIKCRSEDATPWMVNGASGSMWGVHFPKYKPAPSGAAGYKFSSLPPYTCKIEYQRGPSCKFFEGNENLPQGHYCEKSVKKTYGIELTENCDGQPERETCIGL